MPVNSVEMLIKLREKGHPAILDRDTVIADAKEHLTPWLELLRDLVNYGTNLIVRCLHTCEKKPKDRVVLAILLRQAVAMLDSVEVLLSNGGTHPANLELRALFEVVVYIEWILASDSETRARYYHVHNLRRKRLWASRSVPGSPEAVTFANEMGKFGLNANPEDEKKAQEQVAAINQILAQPELASVSAQFDTIRASRKLNHDVAWYVPLGPKNLAAMARTVNQHSLYVLLYSLTSEVVHSSSDDQHIEVEDGKVRIRPIRSFHRFEIVFRFSASLALALYMKILAEYRPGELAAFSRKYVDQWQGQYLNFLKIKYKVHESITL